MKKTFKVLALVLALAMVAVMFGCGGNNENTTENNSPYANVKIGFIFLHEPASSTYDDNFYQAALAVKAKLGLTDDQVKFQWPVAEEGDECKNTVANMVDEGCNIIFADSFGHENTLKVSAATYPNVQFFHATGTQGKTLGLANYHTAFADIYEGRYLAGIAAGMKLNEMIEKGEFTAEEAKIGYVGAMEYSEVISGYTSFYLGAKSVCPTATMEVIYTNSWFDVDLEKNAALNLIADDCKLISQHADSEGAPKACQEKLVPNVAYNKSTINLGPDTAIISSRINWEPYITLMIESVAKGEAVPNDWCGTFENGAVELTELNTAVAAPGTAEAIEEAKAKLISGEINVYDTKDFTVTPDAKGNELIKDNITVDEEGHLTAYLADVVDDGTYVGETDVIKDGVFCESNVEFFRSAPYFNIIIDGITLK